MSDDLQYALAAKEAFAQTEGLVGGAVLGALGTRLLVEFAEAENDRRVTEERWLKDLRQYRGQYDPEVLALIGPKRSRAFVRKTRVKVKTIDSRVEDLLFPSGSEKNWEISPTPLPTISNEARKLVSEGLQKILLDQAKKEKTIQVQRMQAAQAQGQPVPPMPPQQPPMVTKQMVDDAIQEICKKASKKMAKVIDDQLTEVAYKRVSKQAIHSAHLYGTGIVKGPLVERRIRSSFVNEGGKWVEKSESYVVPFVDYVPIWRFYPDMGADTLANCRYVYERHQMVYADLAKLAELKSFNGPVIKSYLKSHPKGEVTVKLIDNELKIIGGRTANQGTDDGKFEVLERWGWLTGEDLQAVGVKVPEERCHEAFFANVWLLPNGEVIKAVLQPINGVTWPYQMYYFDKDETSIFGDGLASIMRDDQTMLNAATRLMLDNAAISSGTMIEVNTNLLSNMEQGTEVEPWKVWFRNNQLPGTPAVRAISLPSNLDELTTLANRFDINIDEISAIPRYMTGENASQGAAATASGMSMLMGAANIMVKDLISGWDEGVTRPFISALYRWNMQFHPDNEIKGDFDVKARGSASLVAREVRAQQLNNFTASVSNELDAPYIKRDSLLRQRAEANELSDVVKTEDEVMAEQNNEMMQMQQQLVQKQQELALAELTEKVKLLTANAAKAMADVDLIRAKTTEVKVGAVYSALQAGGVATQSPQVAPAGDEILRSSGWEDATPDPSIRDLSGAAVQGSAMGQLPPANGPMPVPPQDAETDTADIQDLQPQTGQVGMQAGIETEEI
jgi:hypothetical protein